MFTGKVTEVTLMRRIDTYGLFSPQKQKMLFGAPSGNTISKRLRRSMWTTTCLRWTTKMFHRNPCLKTLKTLKTLKVLITLDARRPSKRFHHLRMHRCLRKSLLMCWSSSRRSVPTTHYYRLLCLTDYTYSVTQKCLVLSLLLFLHRRSLNTDNM